MTAQRASESALESAAGRGPQPKRRPRFAAVGVLTLAQAAVLTLGGCAGSPGANGDPEARSAELGHAIESEMPALVRASGWDSLGELRETSCLGYADPEMASRETKWIGRSGTVGISESDAESLTAEIRETAEAGGWTPKEGRGPQGNRLYGATKGDLILIVTYQSGTGRPEFTLSVHSPCLEMPEGHTMSRSELDPMYGSADPRYPNDDRSKFTNGKPKPLPTSD